MHASTSAGRKVRRDKNREERVETIQFTGRGQETVVPAHFISATIGGQRR